MRESIGKAAARELFYRECLPSWLSTEQLRSGNFLLLLGEKPRELTHLTTLKVPSNHIWSVEREGPIYNAQLTWKTEDGEGLSLYCGEMADYLRYLLHANQKFLVLNLDVEGSYLNQLDPAMTSVMLFCWRNPKTVVATYSSIGRDTHMLWEGIKSLALFLWLAPELTRQAMVALASRYAAASFTEPVRMALRDLFWLRSHLEHSAVATGMVGVSRLRDVEWLFRAGRLIWEAVCTHAHPPLRLDALERIVRKATQQPEFHPWHTDLTPALGVSIDAQQHVIYNAEPPWSQRCYFIRCRAETEPIHARDWLEQTFTQLLKAPLTYFNREGKRRDIMCGESLKLADAILWSDRRLWKNSQPRQIPVGSHTPHLANISETVKSLVASQRQPREIPPPPASPNDRREEVNDLSKPKPANGRYAQDGKLTELGRSELRRLAGKGLTTAEIQRLVPSTVPRQTIIAHVAIAHRPKSRKKK